MASTDLPDRRTSIQKSKSPYRITLKNAFPTHPIGMGGEGPGAEPSRVPRRWGGRSTRFLRIAAMPATHGPFGTVRASRARAFFLFTCSIP